MPSVFSTPATVRASTPSSASSTPSFDLVAVTRIINEANSELAHTQLRSPEEIQTSAKRLLASHKKLSEASDEMKKKGEQSPTSKLLEECKKKVERVLTRSSAVITMHRSVSKAPTKKIQICFLIDATNSMKIMKIMKMAKGGMKAIVQRIRAEWALDCEVAVVGFRDYCDGPEDQFVVCDFVSADRLDEFTEFVDALEPKGGGDTTEDVPGGFATGISRCSWKKGNDSIRAIIFIGDAPGHGAGEMYPKDKAPSKAFDEYPEGDPEGRTIEGTVNTLIALNISLAFLKVTEQTDYMIKRFKKFSDRGALPTVVYPYNNNDNVDEISNKVKKMLMSSASSPPLSPDVPVQEPNDVPEKDPNSKEPTPTIELKGYVLCQAAHNIDEKNALDLSLKTLKQSSIEDCIAKKEGCCPHFEKQCNCKYVVEMYYTARGGIRNMHLGVSGASGKKLCAKSFQRGPDTIERHFAEFKCTFVAKAMACVFCARLDKPQESFRFITTQILIVEDPKPEDPKRPPSVAPIYSLEPFEEGEFVKFNCTTGLVLTDPEYELAQAFSHFTWHITDGKMMVADIQGFYDAAKAHFLLTDPVILTKEFRQSPTDTNIGEMGMQNFFSTHKCGPTCQKLGLADVNKK